MSTTTRTRPVRTLVLVTVAVLGLLGTATPARADSGPPQLSIRVDDGQTEASSGATLRYALTVTNLGGRRVRDLAVSQTVPPRTTLGTVDRGGEASKGVVRWDVDVPAGGSVTLRSSVEVGKDLPPGELRLATVACAGTSPKDPPIVCASDSDQLPAGATAAEQQRQVEQAAGRPRRAWLLPLGLGTGALLVAALAALHVLRRRRGPDPARRGLDSAEGPSLPRGGPGAEEVTPAQPDPGQLLQR